MRGEVESLKRSGARAPRARPARRRLRRPRRRASRSPSSSCAAACWPSSTRRAAVEQLLQGDPARVAWEGPLCVLVDNGTAGAGEIVAGADARRGPRRARGRAHLRPGRGAEGGAPARGRPRAHHRQVLDPEGHRDPRPRALALGGGGRARDDDDDEATPAPATTAKDPILDKALELLEGRARPRRPSLSSPRPSSSSSARVCELRALGSADRVCDGQPARAPPGEFTGADGVPSRLRRCGRRRVWNDPNPTRVTFSPLRRDFVTLSSRASIARSESALVRPVSRATRSISSALFMGPPAGPSRA